MLLTNAKHKVMVMVLYAHVLAPKLDVHTKASPAQLS